MTKWIALVLGAIALVFAMVVGNTLFIVEQTQQSIVTRFGQPLRTIQEPGLNIKMPFVDEVVFYEKRVLDVDPPAQRVILADQKRLDVDSYARYRITDPLLFFQSVRNTSGGNTRLSSFVNSSLRRVLGNESLSSVLSDKRVQIMANIRTEVNGSANRLGMEIVEVRLRRADYPDETRQNIENRMKSERERESREFRAQGFEQAEKIKADADRQRVVIVAEAQKEAETLRGQGDAQAIKIYADAFGQDPEFFAFYRSMQAYRESLANDTTMVLSPSSDFFRFFGNMGGTARPAAE